MVRKITQGLKFMFCAGTLRITESDTTPKHHAKSRSRSLPDVSPNLKEIISDDKRFGGK